MGTMSNTMTAGSWHVVATLGQNTYRERALIDNGQVVGLEARMFDVQGRLLPLPDGRTSLADQDTERIEMVAL